MFNQYVLNPLLNTIKNNYKSNALYINEVYYTYHEFAGAISKIRSALQKEDILNKNIGLVANDDLETYASIFAIWMEGYAYVPLHPNQPLERGLEIIDQANIVVILDSSKEASFKQVKTVASKHLKTIRSKITPKIVPDDALAYILFTSGSTGKPKGVKITRKNIGAFMKSFWETGINITSQDRCLQCFDLTFDVSVQSFLVSLTKGACTYTIPHDQIKYSYVYGLLEDQHISFGAMPPSMIRYLRPYFDEIRVPSMRYNILTAEASPVDLVTEWSACIPNAEIYDFYGPTEATIYCTYNRFSRRSNNKQLNGMMSIGKPMPGVSVLVVDEKNNEIGIGQKGELCVSGAQLTPGYWENPTKNEESFFNIEIEGISTRFYKTGDSCYIDEDYDLMLSGRIDHQVKIQGYRIELGEIEYHAREYLSGQNAVACDYPNHIGNSEIALFIEGTLTDKNKLISYLGKKMPYYMMPTKIITEKIFPINTSGKVDRMLLKNKVLQ